MLQTPEVSSFYDEYLSPHKLTYCQQEIKWLLYHGEILREGHWPMPDPQESTRGQSSGHGPHETACLAIAEVDLRLKDCDQDGLIVATYYSDHDHNESISKNRHHCQQWHINSRELNQIIGRCLYYVSGRRKRYNYLAFCVLVQSGLRYKDVSIMLTGEK